MSERKWATREALVERLKMEVKRVDGQDVLARRLGISPQYLCDVLKFRREPGDKLLKAFGYRRVVIYEHLS